MRRRVDRVRAKAFPEQTCPSSRHLHMMADELAAGRQYFMFTEEPQHCAKSMYAVLETLWKARIENARLRITRGRARIAQATHVTVLSVPELYAETVEGFYIQHFDPPHNSRREHSWMATELCERAKFGLLWQ